MILKFLNYEGFVHNDEFITLYQWHNGNNFPKDGVMSALIESIPLGIPSFKSIASMFEFILQCYKEKVLIIDPKTGLDTSADGKYYNRFESIS